MHWKEKLKTGHHEGWPMLFLGILVLLSLLLSGWIWVQKVNQKGINPITQKNETASVATRDANLSQLLIVNQAGVPYLVDDGRSDLTKIINIMSNWQLGKPEVHKYTPQKFVQEMKRPDTILMAYANPVSGNLVGKTFGDKMFMAGVDGVKYIQLSTTDQDKNIQFFDEGRRKIYRFPLVQSSDKIKRMKLNAERGRVDLTYQKYQVHLTRLEPTKVKIRSYLIETETPDNVANRLFDEKEYTQHQDDEKQQGIYNDGTRRQLIDDKLHGCYRYDYYPKQKVPMNQFDKRSDLANQLINEVYNDESMPYVSHYGEGNTIVYRPYIDNLPVFSDEDYGVLKFNLLNNQHLQIDFSKYVLRVPLPASKNREVTMGSWPGVKQQLVNANFDVTQIQDWVLGYEWSGDEKHQVANLEPHWFIQLKDGEWYPVETYLKGA
ncbi:two-component system activity regulator YycH [Weissella kandleri]|uniref:two-component system activity regulator YycH n=1 Tax=Weissella kandleri TaxID=1616 RepID=UPI00387E30A2